MRPFTKTVGLTLLLIGSLCPSSFGSTNAVETYVSRTVRVNPAPNASPTVYFVVQTEEGTSDSAADSISGGDSVVRKPKDPFKTFVCALVPGAVLHGAGHFYAGKTATGFLLVGGELVGATLAIAGSGKGWGGGYRTNGDVAMELVGGALFFGSWIYDMVGAPLAVHRENQQLLGGENVRLRFGFDQTSHSVRIQIAKRF